MVADNVTLFTPHAYGPGLFSPHAYVRPHSFSPHAYVRICVLEY